MNLVRGAIIISLFGDGDVLWTCDLTPAIRHVCLNAVFRVIAQHARNNCIKREISNLSAVDVPVVSVHAGGGET